MSEEQGTEMAAEAILEQAPDALIFADRAGIVRSWNSAAERIFGHSAAEALGQNLDLIVPEQFRDAHWAGYERAVAEGVSKYAGQALPTRAARADGEQIYVELSFSIARDGNGEVVGALAMVRDITERFTADRAERRRVRELEAALEELRSSAS